MIKYISILRGINVGGHRKILMKDLKEMYVKMGLSNPISYIQSGNVIFECENLSTEFLETKISNRIKDKYDFDVPVLVRSVKEFSQASVDNPYFSDRVDIKSLYLTFLEKVPTPDEIKNLESIDFGEDKLKIIDRVVHAKIVPPYHKSKLSNQIIEKNLNCKATTRNWKTVNKLIELAKS